MAIGQWGPTSLPRWVVGKNSKSYDSEGIGKHVALGREKKWILLSNFFTTARLYAPLSPCSN